MIFSDKYNRYSQLAPIVLGLLLFSVIFCACNNAAKTEKEEKGPLKVVTTTGMIKDIVQVLGGDRLELESLMGPGVDPHLYKATQGDLVKLTKADLILYNGLHLEGKLVEIFEKLAKQGRAVYAVTADIDKSKLLASEDVENKDAYPSDPHIWFDVSLWMEAVEAVRKALIKHDPEGLETYNKNAGAYQARLGDLHKELKVMIGSIPEQQRVLVTSHDAFRYFGRAYGLEVRGLQGISTVSEFGLKDVADLVGFISKRRLRSVFVETSVSDKSLRAVVEGCKAKNHQVAIGGTLYSDAMGAEGTPEGTYIGMVQHNANTVVEGLTP